MAGRAFEPGVSGNPGGRPKIPDEIKELARKYTKPALRRLAQIMRNGQSESACVAAAIALLERGWGKPAQELTGPGGGPIEFAAVLTAARERRMSALEAPLIDALATVIETVTTEGEAEE